MKATLCIDEPVGERRRALLNPFGRPFRIEIERWSEQDKRARLDEVWWGRAKARAPGGRGWFVDLGLGLDGVLETKAAVTEGAMLPVRIKSEAWAEKGSVLSLADMSPSVPRPDRSARHAAQAEDVFLKGVEVVATIRQAPAREEIDAAIEEARQRVVAVRDGGDIAIDETRALTAIDVDAGDRSGAGEAFALELNLAAAEEAARQIGLRGLAGLVAVDFLRMEAKRDQRAVVAAFRSSLATWLGRSSEVLDISQLGVCEAAIARRSRPLRAALAAAPAEREALDALREIESAGWADRGARIQARVSTKAAAWLAADGIDWKAHLADRIGARWTLEIEDRPPGPPRVWSTT